MVMKKTNRSVLLVEDHKQLAETVGEYLEASVYIVHYAADGLTALHIGASITYDAIILDIMLPGVDGLTVCQRLRDDAALTTPIIMLTARDQLTDKLKGFESGADDYLVKPFDMPELEARLDAVVARLRAELRNRSVGRDRGQQRRKVRRALHLREQASRLSRPVQGVQGARRRARGATRARGGAGGLGRTSSTIASHVNMPVAARMPCMSSLHSR